MTSYSKHQNSIDDIINNIKNVIDKNEPRSFPSIESILELTDVITSDSIFNEENSNEISDYVKKISTRVEEVIDEKPLLSDEEIREVFKDVLKPYLQSWLNQNLSKIVKEVVEKEVKILFNKTKI